MNSQSQTVPDHRIIQFVPIDHIHQTFPNQQIVIGGHFAHFGDIPLIGPVLEKTSAERVVSHQIATRSNLPVEEALVEDHVHIGFDVV